MITICFTYFTSLTLDNLSAALYSIRQQNLIDVSAIIILDNNTVDTEEDILAVINLLEFPIAVHLLSLKHKDPLKTHSWSTNTVVRKAVTPWILFSRADYLLDFTLLDKFMKIIHSNSENWNVFITSNGYHLNTDIITCEKTEWRHLGLSVFQKLPGAVIDYTSIDSGVWLTNQVAFENVAGLDETLTSWGHAQTHFQHKLYLSGTTFIQIPEILFYHPQHNAPRDINLAHKQLEDHGIKIKDLWARYTGPQPY